MRAIGVDFGSVSTKAVLIGDDGTVELALSRKNGEGGASVVAEILAAAARIHPGARFAAAIAGTPGNGATDGAARRSGIGEISALAAIARGVRSDHPRARSIIEIGGHASKFVVLDERGGIRDFATNEACAAGTGSFLEQQAKRLTLTAEELAAIAMEAGSGATVAGRCSVFAKSDMIHLQQKGTPAREIAYGLCLAICRNALATLLKGREAEPPVVIAGGIARNAGVVRAFRELLAIPEPGALIVSAHPGFEAALGAALTALESGATPLESGDLARALRTPVAEPARVAGFSPLTRKASATRRDEPEEIHVVPATGFLGIDLGSVSTDLVVIDEEGELLSAVYLPTRGQPVDVLLEGLAILRARFPAGLAIAGTGATGSGRHLAASLAGADVVRNEITCQVLGAQRYLPEADTILEIGGQDSKFVSLRDGMIADFAMNKICAAGTGSFLEEQARELGISIVGEFADRAFRATAPPELGTRCTVFMETEVVNALRAGRGVDDVCAGLALSIVRNYLDKVVGSRPLGDAIVFQGGVASNDAVVAAFESVLGKTIHVHPYNRISGAIGAALAARAARRAEAVELEAMIPRRRPSLRSFECAHCANRCEVNVVRVDRKRAFFGDTCERYTERETSRTAAGLPPNLADEYVSRCEAAFEGAPRGGLTIGIPRASTLFGSLALWATFFKALGHRPVLSEPSSERTLALGLRHLAVGVCLPIKLTAGHVHALLAGGADSVFLPSIVALQGADPARSYSCPYAMAVPFMISGRPEPRILSPVVSLQSEEEVVSGLADLRETLGATPAQIREAWRAGVRAQETLDASMRARAEGLLTGDAARAYRRVFAVLGKPYNTLDGYLNLSLFERLRRLGVLAIPQKLIPVDTQATSQLPWRLSGDIENAAAALAALPHVHPVTVSNFGCGPDAFTIRLVEKALGPRPQLVLEFDEHRAEAGLVTRIEAFLDQLEGRRVAESAAAAPPLPVVEVRPAAPAGPYAAIRQSALDVRSTIAAIDLRAAIAALSKPQPADDKLPPAGAVVRIPFFADHAYAYSGFLRLRGCDARVLPPPTAHIRALGERYWLGKECHAYAMMAGDLVETSRASEGTRVVYFVPGTSLPCLLHQYGQGLRRLLEQLAVTNVSVSAPTGAELVAASSIDSVERFYLGLLSIELLLKAVCQIRPYEREAGRTDRVHAENLARIEAAIAEGDVLEALDESLGRLAKIAIDRSRPRHVVGIAGDIYTKVNPVANEDLFRWLEGRGMEVWPSPFQIDLLDIGLSRNLHRSVSRLELRGLLINGALAARRAIHQWRVRNVVGDRIARLDEPGFTEMKELTAPYMPNDAHQLLFVNVGRIVEFAKNGADGIINAICFNCMVGNASAAVIEKIRRDHDDIPIVSAVYAGGEDPARRLVLETFVAQVAARHQRRAPQFVESVV